MVASKILAIDQGTTSTRALVLTADSRPHIAHAVTHKQSYPASGWVEHDPEELIANILACLEAVPDATAIGIDNQGESCLAWDAMTKEALSPVIVWQDDRTSQTIEDLKRDGQEALTLDRAGLPLDPYFSASKLAWLLRNNDHVQAAYSAGTLQLGTTDAFFLDRLTGNCVTDITTASRTSLMNLETGGWDEDLCRLFGVPITTLPEIVKTTGDFGAIEVKGRRIPVLASVVDQQAALFGHMCREKGDAKITFGTGAFTLMITDEKIIRAPDKGLLPTVAWQLKDDRPVYALDGGVYSACAAVNWGRSIGLFKEFEDINWFDAPPAITRDLVFVPALSGLACPHWDRAARGTWHGLSLEHGPGDLMQAILEGVALRAAEVLSAMEEYAQSSSPLSVDGGLTNNPYFCQFLADLLNRDIRRSPFGEKTAIGTAALCLTALEETMVFDNETELISPARTISGAQDRFAEAVELARSWSKSSRSN